LNILLVDDEPDVRKSLSNFLTKLGHTVICATNGIEGLKTFHSQSFNLVITDIRMPGMDGLEILRRIKTVEKSPVDVIVVTGHGDMDNAIKALKYGAYDYLKKPVNIRELAITIERSAEYAALGLDNLCVYSEAMAQVVKQAEKYSVDRSVPVLIEGESGTGKELVARYIHHYAQGNALNPFVAINCGAISPELFEGELFGHEPGAYTGATSTGRIGKLEAANGGTVLLDEISSMPINLQVKLLRVLEEKKLYRVGGVKEISVDIRFISATNQDLSQAVAKKRFRLDLFYRINTGSIRIPPLRERNEDILPLALRFSKRAFARRGKKFDRFSPAAERFLVSSPWPGNVRQLKNAMDRLALLRSGNQIDVEDLSFIKELIPPNDFTLSANAVLGRDNFDLPEDKLDIENLNRQIIKMALEKNNGNQTRTAQYLAISRRVLQGQLKKMRLV